MSWVKMQEMENERKYGRCQQRTENIELKMFVGLSV